MKSSLEAISNDIEKLDTEKNLDCKIKLHNKINSNIDIMKNKLILLKDNIDTNLESLSQDNIDENTYSLYLNEISDDELNKIMNSDDLDLQIEKYKILINKINLCKKYLESKKMQVITFN